MSEEEKMRIAMDLAKQGIDLEDVEKIALDIYEYAWRKEEWIKYGGKVWTRNFIFQKQGKLV